MEWNYSIFLKKIITGWITAIRTSSRNWLFTKFEWSSETGCRHLYLYWLEWNWSTSNCRNTSSCFMYVLKLCCHLNIDYNNKKYSNIIIIINVQTILFYSDPPEVSVLKSWVNSGEGLEARLDCIVHADPPAEVRKS